MFDEELSGLQSIAAQNVTVDISLSDRVTDCRVLHGYPATDEGAVLRLQVGDLYAREPRPLLAQFLQMPADTDAEADADIPVGTIVVMADVLTADGDVEEREIALPLRLSPVEGGLVEPEVQRTLVLLEAAEEREKALEARTAEECRRVPRRPGAAAPLGRGPGVPPRARGSGGRAGRSPVRSVGPRGQSAQPGVDKELPKSGILR